VCGVRCAVCGVRCAVCGVRWAVGGGPSATPMTFTVVMLSKMCQDRKPSFLQSLFPGGNGWMQSWTGALG
jgi:hypothetical protein